MRRGATLINCARAEICRSEDILGALSDGDLGGYFSDYPEQPLPRDHPLITALTHEGGNTVEAQERCGDAAADQVIDYWRRGNVWDAKVLPSNVMEPSEGSVERIAVLHENTVGMLLQFEQAIKAGGANIGLSQNSPRGGFAYYLADLDDPLDEKYVDVIRATPGVIKVMHFQH